MENNDIKNVMESDIPEIVEESRHSGSGIIPLAFLGGAVLIGGAVVAIKLIQKKMHKIPENEVLDEVVIENDEDDNGEI